MDGLLIVDKPIGPTSHDVVARVRRALHEPRIGHTGTLDPIASGVLALVLGRATRLARFLSADDKSYDAEFHLGVATDTYDVQGTEVEPVYEGPMPSKGTIEQAAAFFAGTFMQQPPPYSAKKIAGKRSYELARAAARAPGTDGVRLQPDPVAVTARAIEVLAIEGNRVHLRIECSAGFYVRSLAHDLGARLGTAAHLTALRRTRAGDFRLEDAIALEDVERNPDAAGAAMIPLARMLPGLAAAILTESGERRVAHGRDVGPGDVQELHESAGPLRARGVRLIDRQGRLLGIAEPATPSGLLHPSVVLM